MFCPCCLTWAWFQSPSLMLNSVPGTSALQFLSQVLNCHSLNTTLFVALYFIYIYIYTHTHTHTHTHTGLFVSPSGISELDCATTNIDTAERSISIGRESLQFCFVLGNLRYFQVPPLGGSREEKWRSQWIRKHSVSWNLSKLSQL